MHMRALRMIRELGSFSSIDWTRSKAFLWNRLALSWQLDIEGLAFVNGQLLLGFRNPVENGRAAILSYDPAADRLAVAARPDLGGHGILGLHYDQTTDHLWLLSNDPLKTRFGDSCLWIGQRVSGSQPAWDFSRDRRFVIEPASAGLRRKASGVMAHDDALIVCFDSEAKSHILAMPRPMPAR
jgi:hypothetical protein